MTTNFLSKGIDFFQQAVSKDNDKEYEIALDLYAKNATIIQVIKDKAVKYLKRAEDIKDALENPHGISSKKGRMKRTKGEKGKSTGNDNKDVDYDEEEVSKMQNGLSSAIVIDDELSRNPKFKKSAKRFKQHLRTKKCQHKKCKYNLKSRLRYYHRW